MPVPDRDELASAYLDGVATPDEVARVEADTDLRARVEELRAVRDAVGATVASPTAADRDRAIEAALAAFGEPATGEQHSAPADLDGARRRRAQRMRYTGIASVAAAAVAVLAATVLIGDDTSDDQIAATGDASSRTTAAVEVYNSDLGGNAVDDSSAGGQTGTLGPSTTPRQFGVVGSLDLLMKAVRDEYARREMGGDTIADAGDSSTSTTTAMLTAPPSEGCRDEAATARSGLGELLFAGVATLDSEQMFVNVFATAEGGWIVVSDSACTPVAQEAL